MHYAKSTQALIGWLTDRYTSRRWPFVTGLLTLLASTLIMWLANPIGAQILSRVLQGIADAVIFIAGMAIIIDTVGTERVSEYMGYVTIALNVGTFAGPLLGGAVYETGGYHAVWGMIMGIVVLDAVLRLVMLEQKSKMVDSDKEDRTGCTRNVALKSCQASAREMDHEPKPRRTTKSKVPDLIRLLDSPRMLTACLGICMQSMVFSGFETVLSIYVQDIWGYNALGAGLLFIPLTIPAFFAPLLGRIVDRTSTRWALVTGFLGMCPVVVLVRFVTYDSVGQKVLMCFFLVVVGVGITITLGPLMAEISHIAEEFVARRSESEGGESDAARSAYAQAYALNAMAWSCGNIAGPLLCGLIKDEYEWGTMCWVLGLLSGLTAIPCFIWSGRPCTTRVWQTRRRGAWNKMPESRPSTSTNAV